MSQVRTWQIFSKPGKFCTLPQHTRKCASSYAPRRWPLLLPGATDPTGGAAAVVVVVVVVVVAAVVAVVGLGLLQHALRKDLRPWATAVGQPNGSGEGRKERSGARAVGQWAP